MKKFLLLLLVLSLAVRLIAPARAEETITVAPLGTETEDDGGDEENEETGDTETAVYETLAEALEAAKYSDESEVIIEIASDAETVQSLDAAVDFEDTAVESITIIGTGSTRIIMNDEGYRHFLINNSGFTLGLKDLTISGGGARVEAGTLSADHVTFRDGDASSLEDEDGNAGGAVSVGAGGTAAFSACTFTANTSGRGGAIYSAGKVTCSDGTIFSANSAAEGGAIYLEDADSAVLAFEGDTGVTFRGNTAQEAGGAVYASRNSKLTSEAGVTFDGNNAGGGQGGALWIHMGSQLEGLASALAFTGNHASLGGAIYIAIDAQSTASFSPPCEYSFTGNHAENGGAICSVHADVVIDTQTISGANTASAAGGFVYGGGNVTVRSSAISGQRAQRGGAIYSAGTVTVEDGSVFSSNSAEAGSLRPVSGGGAIFVEGRITITSSD